MALCSQQFRVFCQLGLVSSVHHPAFLGVVHLKKFHAHHGAAQYVSDRVDAVMNDNDRAVGAMAGDREVDATREKSRFVVVHIIFGALATEGEMPFNAHNKADVGNAKVVEKGFWKIGNVAV